MSMTTQVLLLVILMGPMFWTAILLHELGHALAVLAMGYDARIKVCSARYDGGLHFMVSRRLSVSLGINPNAGNHCQAILPRGRHLSTAEDARFSLAGPLADLLVLVVLVVGAVCVAPILCGLLAYHPAVSLFANVVCGGKNDGYYLRKCLARRRAWSRVTLPEQR